MTDVPSSVEIMEIADQVMRAAMYTRAKEYPMIVGEQEMFNPDLDPPGLDSLDRGRYNELYATLQEEVGWIPDFFSRHICPDPALFDGSVMAMDQAVTALYDYIRPDENGETRGTDVCEIETIADAVGSAVDSWTGAAALNFQTYFVETLEDTAKNQAIFAEMLRQAIMANRDLYAQHRRDIKNIGESAITALESIHACGGTGTSTVTLGVASAVATISAGAASVSRMSGAEYAAALFTIIAGVTSGIAAIGSTGDQTTSLSAATTFGVLDKMMSAVTTTDCDRDTAERTMADTMSGNYQQFSANRNLFVAPRPGFVDSVGRGEGQETFVP